MERDQFNELHTRNQSFWRRRTLCEKSLLLAMSLIIFAALTAFLTLLLLSYIPTLLPNEIIVIPEAEPLRAPQPSAQQLCNDVNSNQNLCLTAGCIKSAAMILESLDETVDPCVDFYDFACGNFIRTTFIPDDKITMMTFVTVHDKVQEQLRTILNEELLPEEPMAFSLAKILNKSCLNLTMIEKRGTRPLADILETYGGWPVVKGDAWLEEEWDWIQINKQIQKDGLDDSLLFNFAVTTDQKNSTRRVLDLDQPEFSLSRQYLIKGIDHINVKAYFNFMVESAVIFGANRTQAEQELMESLLFEIELAKIALPEEERRDSTALYNPMTIRQLDETYPYLEWLKYMNATLPDDLTINENEIVIVDVPNYFAQLGLILERTPKRVIANYFMWRSVYLASGYLNQQLHKVRTTYLSAIIGKKEEESRFKECVSIATTNLPVSVGALYVRKYFDEASKKAAVDLVNNIQEEFIGILRQVPWMDNETRTAAIEKAKTLTNHIAYPDELLDNKKLEQYYKGIVLEPDNLLVNILRLRKFEDEHSMSKLRKPVNKTDWETHTMPATVNAMYSPLENSIQIPAAILQERFFSADHPSYMNYGAIGQIIGHEITHGFDDQGRQFDLNGNLEDWWQADTQKQFLEKARCIIEQYAQYTSVKTNLTLNGVNTQGENIADNGGVKEAYLAYKKFVKRNGPEPYLPGLNYTQEQLFWISAAQTWCAVTRPEFESMLITTDVHSPNEFRVIGPISNINDFAQDFSCPIGSRMNPVKKCEVW